MKVYVIMKGDWSDPSSDDEIHGVVSSKDIAQREVDRLNNEATKDYLEYNLCEDYECRKRITARGYYPWGFVYEEAVLDGCLEDKEEE